jgi:hypothetical protein
LNQTIQQYEAGKQLQANVTFLLHAAVVVVTAGVVVAAAGVDVVTRHLDLTAAQAHAAILVIADPNSCCKDDSDEQPQYIQGKQSKTVMTYLLYKMF